MRRQSRTILYSRPDSGHPSVKRQEVIAGRFESGHGCDAPDALMRAMPVVVMDPGLEVIGALDGVLVYEAVSPLAQCRLDEALGPAVGLRTGGSGKTMFDVQLGAGLDEVLGAKRRTVVGSRLTGTPSDLK